MYVSTRTTDECEQKLAQAGMAVATSHGYPAWNPAEKLEVGDNWQVHAAGSNWAQRIDMLSLFAA